LVPLPKDKNNFSCKWVYKTKCIIDEQIEKHKDRIHVKGFSNKEGIDYNENFSLFSKIGYIRMILSTVSSKIWEVLLSHEVFMGQISP
jgi:hypothetical protein